MMVVDVDDIRSMLPARQPVGHGDLKGDESFVVIFIAINTFPVEETMHINEVQIKTEPVGRFLYDRVFEPGRSEGSPALVDDSPLVFVEETCPVHGHDHLGYMSRLLLIPGQCTHHISKAARLGDRITLCRNVNDFHVRLPYEVKLVKFAHSHPRLNKIIFNYGISYYFHPAKTNE